MTEKEGRIVVSKWFPEYMSADNITLIVFQSQLNDKSMTRAEAVERMAKAMTDKSNITYISDEQWKFVINGFRISAEAALEALLGYK